MDLTLTPEGQQKLAELKLPRYDDLPTFGVYVDQLISYVNDTVGFSLTPEEKPLTASMVNNYVKQGVVPKPEKKKYTRDHIAYLIAVCILKKVFSIQEVTTLIRLQIDVYPTDQAYDLFVDSLEQCIFAVFSGEGTLGGAASSDRRTLLVERAVLTFSNKLFVQMRIVNAPYTLDKEEAASKSSQKDKRRS